MGGLTARVIAAIRAYKGTLRRFSEESGIPYPSLMDYKSGKRNPGTDALIAIVKTVDVSPAWLLTGEGDMYQHRATTKTVHADGKLLSRAATELALAWIRVKEQGKDAVSAVLEALPLNDQQYRKLIAKESGIEAGEVEGKIEHVVYMTVLAATIYNLFADIKDEEERNREMRQQAYVLLTHTQAPQHLAGGSVVDEETAPAGEHKLKSEKHRKSDRKTRPRKQSKK